MAERTIDIGQSGWRSRKVQEVSLPHLLPPVTTKVGKIRRKLATGAGVTALLTAGYLLYPANFANTLRVGKAEVGISVSCDNPSNPNGPILIADLGGGGRNGEGGWRLTDKAELRTQAAVDLYLKDKKEGKEAKIGLIDGTMDLPRRQLQYLELFYRKRTGKKIDRKDVIVDNQSTDTRTNADRIKVIFDSGNFGSVQVDTSADHLGRAMVAVCGQGLPAEGYAAEAQLPDTKGARQLLQTANLGKLDTAWINFVERIKTLPYLLVH